MGTILLNNVKIVGQKTVSKEKCLLIREGTIEYLSDKAIDSDNIEVFDLRGKYISSGWFDFGIQACDPGFEHRETLQSAATGALNGGFTAVANFPNTKPAIHSKSEVLYIHNASSGLPVAFYPVGAISEDCAGKDMAELYDMHHAGACAFGDGATSVQDAGLLLRAMLYVKAFNGLVVNIPYHKTLASGGQMHEGIVSTSLGLKGIPALAEELMVQRDLSLLEYAESRLHIHLISTAKSVAMIRAAKKAGLRVTCSVAIANLCFTDENLREFDSNWKIMPPLRGEQDRQALLEGLEDGTIDMICSNHRPWDEEAKNLEFPYAEFGMTAMETLFALYCTYLSRDLNINQFVDKIAFGPRALLGLNIAEIKVGEIADLTIFDQEDTWNYDQTKSLSNNTPFWGNTLKGRVLGTISKGKITLKS